MHLGQTDEPRQFINTYFCLKSTKVFHQLYSQKFEMLHMSIDRTKKKIEENAVENAIKRITDGNIFLPG